MNALVRSVSPTAGRASARAPKPVSRWLSRTDRSPIPRLAEFFAANVPTCYISHTELWSGRARDFAHWAPGLKRVIEKELRATFRDRAKRIAVVERAGELVGMAVIVDLGRYALLEDIVIKRDRRGRGVGRTLVRWLFARLRAAGKASVFLESGGRNVAAHRFFKRQGFRRVSISMCRRLAA
jgi:ribosomal protein S18 acetylase RimI-like enzyme